MRKVIFANGETYHIYNRGVDKRVVFSCKKDYQRFLLSMTLLNDERDGLMLRWRDYIKRNPGTTCDAFLKLGFRTRAPLVEIVAYCLNPNHYHFILRQIKERGIERLMHKIGISHTKYFNEKNKRSGFLFQGKFKAVHIDSNEYLLYLSAYVNRNNYIHGYNKNDHWQHSSLADYLGEKQDILVHESKAIILGQFRNISEYKKFLHTNALHMQKRKELAKYLLEE